jgi:hypothetical protein
MRLKPLREWITVRRVCVIHQNRRDFAVHRERFQDSDPKGGRLRWSNEQKRKE